MKRSALVLAAASVAALSLAAHAAGPQLFPAPNAKGVCPDTPLHITFDAPPTLGTGKIEIVDAATKQPVETIDVSKPSAKETVGGLPEFSYHPVMIEGNELSIYPHDHALDYHKTYYVTIEPSAISENPNIRKPTDWQFTTKDAPPAADTTNITVAADGSGDFATVQGALDFIPNHNDTPRTITLKKGKYVELVYVANKNHLTIRGEDRQGSVIEYPNNDKFNHDNAKGIYHRGVFLADHCDDLTLTNLTIHDTTPQGGSQAEAIILNGTPKSRAILAGVDLHSYQDTLQINCQAYITNCFIDGDVDFMWGKGPCFFENTECKGLRTKSYFTQIRNPESNHGYVYYHCTFDSPEKAKDIFLSRIAPAVFPYSEVVLIDCTMSPHTVNPMGWLLNGPRGKKMTQAALAKEAPNVHFWEYNSHTPEGQPIDTSKRSPVGKVLTEPADEETIRNYSDPAWVLGDGWNPRENAVVKQVASQGSPSSH